jgi:hypothetical protein
MRANPPGHLDPVVHVPIQVPVLVQMGFPIHVVQMSSIPISMCANVLSLYMCANVLSLYMWDIVLSLYMWDKVQNPVLALVTILVVIRWKFPAVAVFAIMIALMVIFTFMVSMIIVRVIIPIPIPWVIAPIIIAPIPWVIIIVRITRIVTGLSVITRCLVNYIDRDLIARLTSQNVR